MAQITQRRVNCANVAVETLCQSGKRRAWIGRSV